MILTQFCASFKHVQAPKETTEVAPTPVAKDASDELLLSLLHLVDRYWNGSKSLHYHSKFQGKNVLLLSLVLL